MKLEMWEIFVPKNFPRTHHREWDKKVAEVTKGLTLMPNVRGKWKNQAERSIPVRIACTTEQIAQIAKMTIEHYKQDAVLYWRVSDCVEVVTKEQSHGETEKIL